MELEVLETLEIIKTKTGQCKCNRSYIGQCKLKDKLGEINNGNSPERNTHWNNGKEVDEDLKKTVDKTGRVRMAEKSLGQLQTVN